nr:MAG TPA: hypothetical protein [Herelleviridae sp.]
MTMHKDILKIEFKDSLEHFDSDRHSFRMYRINRLITNGSIIDFDYFYLPSDDPHKVVVKLDLKSYGSLTFEIDIKTSYGKILTNNYNDVVQNFINDFNIYSDSEKFRL